MSLQEETLLYYKVTQQKALSILTKMFKIQTEEEIFKEVIGDDDNDDDLDEDQEEEDLEIVDESFELM